MLRRTSCCSGPFRAYLVSECLRNLSRVGGESCRNLPRRVMTMVDQSAAPEMSEPGDGLPASAEPDTISLELGDLLPDSAGNIVIEYDGGNLAVQLMTDQSVIEHGVAVE